ncbi:hypothetical protein JKP88DRAFT_241559 [Tribonema minus]|uniref:IPT/TIG domain-containing protein n=1 Tax=Tribonema minus TaxID=303371 RepID=A0A836CD49_9STRA|nr:hypothetical protein JKP88DRAFT_241559 [Tribonema minus]
MSFFMRYVAVVLAVGCCVQTLAMVNYTASLVLTEEYMTYANATATSSGSPTAMTNLQLGDEEVAYAPLVQPWTFYGMDTLDSYDGVDISSDGWISFVDPLGNPWYNGHLLGQQCGPGAMIAPFWMDLYPGDQRYYTGESGVYIGYVDNLRFKGTVIAYDRVPIYMTPLTVSFEIGLADDGTGTFTIVYDNLESIPDYVVVGWQTANATVGTTLCSIYNFYDADLDPCWKFLKGAAAATTQPGTLTIVVAVADAADAPTTKDGYYLASGGGGQYLCLRCDVLLLQLPESIQGSFYGSSYTNVTVIAQGLIFLRDLGVELGPPDSISVRNVDWTWFSGYPMLAPLYGPLDLTCGGTVYAGETSDGAYAVVLQDVQLRDSSDLCDPAITADIEVVITTTATEIGIAMGTNAVIDPARFVYEVGWSSVDGIELICSNLMCQFATLASDNSGLEETGPSSNNFAAVMFSSSSSTSTNLAQDLIDVPLALSHFGVEAIAATIVTLVSPAAECAVAYVGTTSYTLTADEFSFKLPYTYNSGATILYAVLSMPGGGALAAPDSIISINKPDSSSSDTAGPETGMSILFVPGAAAADSEFGPKFYFTIVFYSSGIVTMFWRFWDEVGAETLLRSNTMGLRGEFADATPFMVSIPICGFESCLDRYLVYTMRLEPVVNVATAQPVHGAVLAPGSRFRLKSLATSYQLSKLDEGGKVDPFNAPADLWNYFEYDLGVPAPWTVTSGCQLVNFQWPGGDATWDYHGHTYSGFHVCPAGYIVMGGEMTSFIPSWLDRPGLEMATAEPVEHIQNPIIAPFWADLDGYSMCTNSSCVYEDDETLVVRQNPAVPTSHERGTFVHWEVVLHKCGDFEIKIIDTDFDLSSAIDGNVTIGWQDASGTRGLNVCHGESCNCRSTPLYAYASSGLCTFAPSLTGGEVVVSDQALHHHLHGAAGGDQILLKYRNFKYIPFFVDTSIYQVRYTNRDDPSQFYVVDGLIGADITLDTANSQLNVTTPAIGDGKAGFRHAVISVLYTADDVLNTLDTTFECSLETAWTGMVAASGPARDFEDSLAYVAAGVDADGTAATITVQGKGFSSDVDYYLQYTMETVAGMDSATLPAEAFATDSKAKCFFVNGEELACPAVNWGFDYRAGLVTVDLVRLEDDTLLPVLRARAEALVVEVVPQVLSKDLNNSGAGGGTSITVYGAGFIVEDKYNCVFYTSDESLSTAAVFLSNTALTCQAPVWGGVQPAGDIEFTVEVTSSGASKTAYEYIPLPLSQGQGFSIFTFWEEWEATTVTDASAAGGALLTILGYGFLDSTGEYVCKIGDTGGAVPYASTSLDGIWIKPRLITCETTPYDSSVDIGQELRVIKRTDNTPVPRFGSNATNFSVPFRVSVYRLDIDATDYYIQFKHGADSIIAGPAQPSSCVDSTTTPYCLTVTTPRWVYAIQNNTVVDITVVKEVGRPIKSSVKYTFNAYKVDLYRVSVQFTVVDLQGEWTTVTRASFEATVADITGVTPAGVAIDATAIEGRRLSTNDLQISATIVVQSEAEAAAAVKALGANDDLTAALAVNGVTVGLASVSSVEQKQVQGAGGVYSCVICSAGTYCTNPRGCDGKCDMCPTGADCSAQGTGIPPVLPAYWRAQPESADTSTYGYHACVTAANCLGGADSVCADNFYLGTDGSCNICQGSAATAKLSKAGIIIVFLLAAAVIMSGMGGAAAGTTVKAGIVVLLGTAVVMGGMVYYLKSIFNPAYPPPTFTPEAVDAPDPYQNPPPTDPMKPIPFYARKERRRSSIMMETEAMAAELAVQAGGAPEAVAAKIAARHASCITKHQPSSYAAARGRTTGTHARRSVDSSNVAAGAALQRAEGQMAEDGSGRGSAQTAGRVAGHAVMMASACSLVEGAMLEQNNASKDGDFKTAGGTTVVAAATEQLHSINGMVGGGSAAQQGGQHNSGNNGGIGDMVEIAGANDTGADVSDVNTGVEDGGNTASVGDAADVGQQAVCGVKGMNHATRAVDVNLGIREGLSALISSISSKMKVSIGFVQVFSSLQMNVSVHWPDTLMNLMVAMKVININIINIPGLSLSCIKLMNIYMAFLAAIFTPIIIAVGLCITYIIAGTWLKHKARQAHSQLRASLHERKIWMRNKMLTLLLWLTLLIYPTVSRTIFQLDNGQRYLHSDLSVDCNTPLHNTYQAAAIVACLFYTVGIPVALIYVLKTRRFDPNWRSGLSFLFNNYEAPYWWFEVYDMVRRMVLVGLIIFIMPDLLQLAAMTVLALTYYCGLLIMADVSGEDNYNVTLFNGFILLINGALICIVMPVTFLIQLRMLSKSAKKFVSSLSPRVEGLKLAVSMRGKSAFALGASGKGFGLGGSGSFNMTTSSGKDFTSLSGSLSPRSASPPAGFVSAGELRSDPHPRRFRSAEAAGVSAGVHGLIVFDDTDDSKPVDRADAMRRLGGARRASKAALPASPTAGAGFSDL